MRMFDPDGNDDPQEKPVHRPKLSHKAKPLEPPKGPPKTPQLEALEEEDDAPILTDCDEITAMRWVAANIDATPRRQEAPSKGAWALLKSVRTDDKTRDKFWEKFMSLAARQDDKSNDTLGQTGRFTVALLEEMIAYCAPDQQDDDEIAEDAL